MQPLPSAFTEGRFHYRLLTREGMYAIYAQTHKEGAIARYEVVRILVSPAHTWPTGTTSPERETYPGASRWGQDGSTCFSLDEARALYAQLLEERTAHHAP